MEALSNEPHKIADLYRNCQPTIEPVQVEKHLEFIDISEDGHTIVGSSDLCGRYWRGAVWYFKDPSLAPHKKSSETGFECSASVCDGKFLDSSKKVIVGDDLGVISVYELNETDYREPTFDGKHLRNDHDNCVLSVQVSTDKSAALTAGMDLCIKVWDLQELVPTQVFVSAHSHHVTSCAYSADLAPHTFASCGLDGRALLWDTRQSKPATELLDNPSEGLTALAWQQGDSNMLLVGSTFGQIFSIDLRAQGASKQVKVHERGVYKLLSIQPSLLATCADSIDIRVVDPLSEDLALRYEDKRHTDFVRGLGFDKKSQTLYSCGWDTNVFSHKLPI